MPALGESLKGECVLAACFYFVRRSRACVCCVCAPLRLTRPLSRPPAHFFPRTTNNQRTYVLRGQLVAQPYATSVKAGPPKAEPFGKVNTILNPPNAERATHYSSTHNAVACTVQTAGTLHKRKVPYSMNAPRNRINNPQKNESDPFNSHLDLQNGGISNSTVYPYRTISRTVQKPAEKAMETRTGWTNPDICASLAQREHKKLWR